MQIHEIPLDDVRPYPGNPRLNDAAVAPVAESIREFGFQQPLVVDRDGTVIVGHTRLLAAKKLGLAKVPVVRADDLTPEQVRAYRLADNRTAQNAGWDWGLVGAELASLMSEGPSLVPVTGFDREEVRKALDWGGEMPGQMGRSDPDARPDPVTRPGDVWTSDGGEHVVLCCENNGRQFAEFIAGRQVDCILTDPPYNVSMASKKGAVNNDSHASWEEYGEFLRECFGPAVGALRPGGAVFTFGNQHGQHPSDVALTSLGVPLKYELFWVKDRLIFSRGPMQFLKQHENVWVGWKQGAPAYGNPAVTGKALLLDDREDWDKMSKAELLARLVEIHEAFSTVRTAAHERDDLARHPTVKPTALLAPMVRKSTLPGDTVLDIFAGVGATALACQELGRRSISVEMDPSYVDCILDRMLQHKKVDFTDGTGRRWSDLRDAPVQAGVEENLSGIFDIAAA